VTAVETDKVEALEKRVGQLEQRLRTLMIHVHRHCVLVIGSEGLSRETMDEADALGQWVSVENTLKLRKETKRQSPGLRARHQSGST
jgi:hypothetical protein